MTNTSDKLLLAIRELEAEVEREFTEQRRRFHYTFKKKRVTFEAAVRQQHKKFRVGLARFLRQSGPARIFGAAIVYAQIVPLLLLDVAVSLFQWVCFPIYNIDPVPRGDFIVIDRHHLAYLNPIEKLNCAFCGYANGLLAYAREIAGRAEAHWCPIKHARKTRGQHRRYWEFADYGDAETYRKNQKDN